MGKKVPIGACIDECIEVALMNLWTSNKPSEQWAYSYLPKEKGDDTEQWQVQYSQALREVKKSMAWEYANEELEKANDTNESIRVRKNSAKNALALMKVIVND